jgi:hypothetical protein
MAEKDNRELSDEREELLARIDELKTAKAKEFKETVVDVLMALFDGLLFSMETNKKTCEALGEVGNKNLDTACEVIGEELSIIKRILWTEAIENAEYRQSHGRVPLNRELKKDLAGILRLDLDGTLEKWEHGQPVATA